MIDAYHDIKLADMTMRDVPAVHALEEASFSCPWDIASYYRELQNPSAYYQVAFLDDQVVGFGGMWVVGDEAHVVTLAVDPAHRRHGIARRLMDALIYEAKQRGATRVTLEVRVHNTPAQNLYLSMGFRTIAFRREYYPDNNEDAAVMALELAPA